MMLLYTMSAFCILLGILHFIFPKSFEDIIPKYIPYRLSAVYISRIFEIILVVLLFTETTSYSAIGIILLLIAVFPANIYMAQQMKQKKNKYAWIAFARLPLQFFLIYWAWIFV